MLSDKGPHPSWFGIFRFFTTDEKKLFSSFATIPQSVTKESFNSVKLILSEIELYSIKTVSLFSRNVCCQLFTYLLKFYFFGI